MRIRASGCAGLLVVLLGGALATAGAAPCDKVVVTADPEYPPLHWYDGSALHGASVRVVTRVLDDIGVPYELRYVGPFARVMSLAQAGQVDVVTTLKITPERQAFLTFTTQPAFVNPVAVFVARDKPIAFEHWTDLQGHLGGVVRGNRFGEPFDEFMHRHLRIEEVDTLAANFRKLELGRLDYVVTGYYAGMASLGALRLDDRIVPLKRFVNESANHVAFVSASPCMQYFDAFNRRLGELVKAGVPQEMISESLKEWRASPVLAR